MEHSAAYARAGHGVLPPPPPQWLHIIVSGEAVLSAEYSGKPLGGRDSARNPAGGSQRSFPRPSSRWADDVPSPRNPSPLSAFGPTSCLTMKNPGHTPENTLLRVSVIKSPTCGCWCISVIDTLSTNTHHLLFPQDVLSNALCSAFVIHSPISGSQQCI